MCRCGKWATTKLLDCSFDVRLIGYGLARKDSSPGALCPVWRVVFLLYYSRVRVLKVQRGAYKLVKQCRTSRSPTLSYAGAFPFIVQGGAPIYSYLALCHCTVGVVGELDPGNLLV